MKSQIMNRRVPIGTAIALGLITLLGPASIDMYLPSLLVMSQELGSPYATLQLTLTVFLLAMGAGQLVFGPVIDAFGRRRPLLVALAVFVVTSLWAGAAQSVDSLILARFLQGLAASLALVTAMSSVRDVAEGVAAAQIFALLMTIQGLGPVMSPVLGGVIGASVGWRAVFYTLALLGVLVLVNTVFALYETLPRDKRSSLNPFLVLRTYVSIVSDRHFLLPGMSLAASFFFLFGYIGGAAYTYQSVYGLSPSAFGFVFGATGIAVLIGAMGTAWLLSRFRIEILALAGVLTMLGGGVISLLSIFVGGGLPGIVVGMFLALAGIGIAEATLISIALASRNTAMGASTALLGAIPLILGAAATPLAALLAESGPGWWLAFLVLTGVFATGLTLASTIMVSRSGITVAMQH